MLRSVKAGLRSVESRCVRTAFELGDDLGAGASPPDLDGILDASAEVVPDVLVARHRDPRVLVSRQPGLDAHDVGYLVVHRPSGAVRGFREVVLAAAMGKIDDGLGGLGKGLDEVGQMPRRWRIQEHSASLLRLCT